MRAALPTRDRNWEIVTRKIRVMRIGETSFRLQYLKESTQTRDAYLVEFDLLRRKADGLMQNGVSFLDSSTAAVGQQSANLPNREKSSAQAGTHVALATVEIAHQMRLFFWIYSHLSETGGPGAAVELEPEGQETHPAHRKASDRLHAEPKPVRGVLKTKPGERLCCYLCNIGT